MTNPKRIQLLAGTVVALGAAGGAFRGPTMRGPLLHTIAAQPAQDGAQKQAQQQQQQRGVHSSSPSPALAAAAPGSALAPSPFAAALLGAPHHGPRVKALLVDAAGTLLIPSEPVTDVYLRAAERHGVSGISAASVLENFRRAYNTAPRYADARGGRLRYVDDARPFWRHVVAASLGGRCSEAIFEEVYTYYSSPDAWRLAPGAVPALTRLRAAGLRLAVVSNFDTRLRPVLAGLGVDGLFDAIVVSAEVGAEKPSPVIFEAAVQQLGVAASECVHVGDDRRNDVWGGRDAGVTAWLWGCDVHTFAEVARRVLAVQRAGLMASLEEDEDED